MTTNVNCSLVIILFIHPHTPERNLRYSIYRTYIESAACRSAWTLS